MLRWLATKRTNLPFLAPLSTDATVNVTVSGVVSVVATAFADLVFVDVVMMTFLSVWTLFLFVYLFLFSLGGLATHASVGAQDQREIIPLFAVCCTAGSGRHYARQPRYRP